MRNSIQKKHHFVPQFILKNFSFEKKKKIWIFDKLESRSFQASILDTGAEKYFYELSSSEADIDSEKRLSALESKCAPIIEKIVSGESLINLSQDEYATLCLFCSVQNLRTNYQRDCLSQFNQTLMTWITENGHDPSEVENFKDMSPLDIKDFSIYNMYSMGADLAKHFFNKDLFLVKAPNGCEFLLSDHPITLHNNYPRPNRGDLGLALKGIEIHFPITPKLCLIFLCSEMIGSVREQVYMERHRRSLGMGFPVGIREAEELIDAIDQGCYRVLKPENVEFLNSLQIIRSGRFIYGTKDKFDLVIDMIRTNPEVRKFPELGVN